MIPLAEYANAGLAGSVVAAVPAVCSLLAFLSANKRPYWAKAGLAIVFGLSFALAFYVVALYVCFGRKM